MLKEVRKNLMQNYENVVARYTDCYNSDVAIVEHIIDTYFITFNYLSSPCNGGRFYTLEEAKEQIRRLRGSAIKCNSICNNCVNPDCYGTKETVWTGCIFRKSNI